MWGALVQGAQGRRARGELFVPCGCVRRAMSCVTCHVARVTPVLSAALVQLCTHSATLATAASCPCSCTPPPQSPMLSQPAQAAALHRMRDHHHSPPPPPVDRAFTCVAGSNKNAKLEGQCLVLLGCSNNNKHCDIGFAKHHDDHDLQQHVRPLSALQQAVPSAPAASSAISPHVCCRLQTATRKPQSMPSSSIHGVILIDDAAQLLRHARDLLLQQRVPAVKHWLPVPQPETIGAVGGYGLSIHCVG